MRYLSVCAGIEAATVAWHPLGWEPAAFSEIDPFPRAVLAHHYPDVPLHGDFTTIGADDYGSIDILVGGTPCQDFSVAGLRAGITGDRGNLTLEFLRLAARSKPRWIVWENVPGVLSSDGGRAITSFMDGLEALGYICDIEILDAQFFGLAQRRRRVFVCAQHRDDLLKQRTDTSALTIAQVLQEILHAVLVEASTRSGSALASSASPSLSRDGAKRRMELFGLHGEVDCWPMLLANLTAAFQRYPSAQSALAAILGESEKAPTRAARSTASQAETLFTRTERLLSAALADAYEAMKSFITSTGTNSTTPTQIYSCSKAALLIAALTRHLNQSSPTFWSAASSSLTAVEEFIAYARHTSSDLFGDLERVQSWRDFIEQAEGLCESLGDIGIDSFGEVFPLTESLLGHPAPRREAGKGVAPTISARPSGGGGLGTDFDCDGGLVTETVGALCADAHPGGYSGQDAYTGRLIAHALRAEGFDASEDGTGRGTPLVPVAYSIMPMNSGKDYKARETDIAQPIMAGGPVGGNQGGDFIVKLVPFDTTQITSKANYSKPKAGDPCHPLATGAHPPAIAFSVKDHGADAGPISPTLRAGGHAKSHANGGVMPAIAFEWQRGATQNLDMHEDFSPALIKSQTPAVPFDLRGREGGAQFEGPHDTANIRAASGGSSRSYVAQAVGFDTYNQSTGDINQTLQRGTGTDQISAIITSTAVRRLTPRECERLQGFPDDYTLVLYRNKPASDGPRYKALGNSMAVPCMAWIGQRIAMIETLIAA